MHPDSPAGPPLARITSLALVVALLTAVLPAAVGGQSRPTLSVVEATHREPTAGTTNTLTVTIRLQPMSSEQVRFTVRTEPSTVGGASATAGGCGTTGADYQALASTTRTIPSNTPTITIPITVCNDGIHDGNEFFRVRIDAVETGNADILSPGYWVIMLEDADPAPTIAIGSNVSVGASSPVNSLTREARFRVTLSGTQTQRPVTFSYKLVDGTGKAGTSCLDLRLGSTIKPAAAYFATSGSNVTVTPAGADIPVTICQPASGKDFTLQLFGIRNASPTIVERKFTIP